MRSQSLRRQRAFTLVELVVVMGVMGLLMSMVLGVQRYAQSKSNRSRAEAQIAGFTAAAEAYKADNALYPRSAETDALSSIGATGSAGYTDANLALYLMLSGDTDLNGRADATEGKTDAPPVYLAFTPSQLSLAGEKVLFVRDAWGKPYGYSTKRAAALDKGTDDASAGHNITFDVWSTGGVDENEKGWIANW